jgi:hypothetical protein
MGLAPSGRTGDCHVGEPKLMACGLPAAAGSPTTTPRIDPTPAVSTPTRAIRLTNPALETASARERSRIFLVIRLSLPVGLLSETDGPGRRVSDAPSSAPEAMRHADKLRVAR